MYFLTAYLVAGWVHVKYLYSHYLHFTICTCICICLRISVQLIKKDPMYFLTAYLVAGWVHVKYRRQTSPKHQALVVTSVLHTWHSTFSSRIATTTKTEHHYFLKRCVSRVKWYHSLIFTWFMNLCRGRASVLSDSNFFDQFFSLLNTPTLR